MVLLLDNKLQQFILEQKGLVLNHIMDAINLGPADKWCFSIFLKASTPASQSTKDSGVGLPCPMSTPVRKGHGEGKQKKKEAFVTPTTRACWAYTPVRSSLPQSPRHEGRSTSLGLFSF